MRSAITTVGVRVAALAVIALVLTGCTTSTEAPEATDAPSKVAFLLPESKTTRYESADRPYFKQRLSEVCPDCELIYSNADGDAAKQQQQAESALTQNIEVMVLDAVDSAAAISIVASANARGVPVIAYDRVIAHADVAYYVSFDGEAVGSLQGGALVDALDDQGKADGNILMINGSPTDSNASDFKQGAHRIIDASSLHIIGEYDSPDWSPDKAQEWVAGQIVLHGGAIDGIYAANDGTAGGAIAALRAAGVTDLPLVTGQDAELAAIQRIITGDQYMTVYKAISNQASAAAEAANDLMSGKTLTSDLHVQGVPATLLQPVAVTKANIMETVVADGFYTVQDICTAEYARACVDAGIE